MSDHKALESLLADALRPVCTAVKGPHHYTTAQSGYRDAAARAANVVADALGAVDPSFDRAWFLGACGLQVWQQEKA